MLVGVNAPGFEIKRTLDRVRSRLLLMFPDADPDLVEIITKPKLTTMNALRDRFASWQAETRPTDICLFYYFGHGGRLRCPDLSSPTRAELVTPYLTCTRAPTGEFSGLLSTELSRFLTQLDRVCANVTAIIDACYSGTVMRDGTLYQARAQRTSRTLARTPAWVQKELERGSGDSLAFESHPRVVRLAGASPRSAAHAVERGDDTGVGMLSATLLQILAELGDDWPRLSWTMLAHAVRERIITAHGMESQWVSLAGPGYRLLFSRDRTRSLRAVGYRAASSGSWIRAGRLAGVEAGDRWAVLDPFVGPDTAHAPLALAQVVADDLGPNVARLEFDGSPPPANGLVAAAAPVRVARPLPVTLAPSLAAEFDLTRTVWLERGGNECRNQVERVDDELVVRDRARRWVEVRVADGPDGRARVIDLLEDRARAIRLVENTAAANEVLPHNPIEWRLGLGPEEFDQPAIVEAPPPTVDSGAALWVRLRHTGSGGPHWFTSIVLIDVIGRPWLLNSSQLHGVELEADDLEFVGRRPGATDGGLLLDWPELACPRSKGGRVELVFISSQRPMQLAHLTRALPSNETAAFRMQGLDPHHKGEALEIVEKAPELSYAWACSAFELELRPQVESPH